MTLDQHEPTADIKHVPRDSVLRASVRRAAVEVVAADALDEIPSREMLDRWGRAILAELAISDVYRGFAMVAANNAFWASAFAAIPFHRRLLLLPHCLRDEQTCAGAYDAVGLHCAGCSRCDIAGMQAEAKALGYSVIVAEGTSAVLMKILDGEADAILGVACLASLEKSYLRIADLGIPNVAVPLLTDGCRHTEADWDTVRTLLHARSDAPPRRVRGYVPLLRETAAIFTPEALTALLGVGMTARDPSEPLEATDALALDWLRTGGKRLRPFVTTAAYAVAQHGAAALEPDAPVARLLPPAVRRIAVAIEALHKASLAHDDIEDDEAERYGAPTLHRAHGEAMAINIGDYLVGLGYRLIAGEAKALGAECVADILQMLSTAHLDLCRGQGAELLQRRGMPKPVDVLSIYALKTAPAFEVALYAGLRAAGLTPDPVRLKRFTLYLGEGYQIADDLAEWREDVDDARLARELDMGVPTIIHAFACEADDGRLAAAMAEPDPLARVARIRACYRELGAFDQAVRLRDRLRARALSLLPECEEPALRNLLTFLARVLLPEERWALEALA
jgi:geranylgeranyl diphosphate synthase type II